MVFFTTHSPAGLAKPFLTCAWLMAASRRLTVEVFRPSFSTQKRAYAASWSGLQGSGE